MYVQPLDVPFSPNSLAPPAGALEGENAAFAGAPTGAPGDNISRLAPPWQDPSGSAPFGDASTSSLQGMFGPLMGILQQLMQMLQSMMGYGCNGSSYGGCPPYGNQQYFQNANGASEGDPHLSFDGSKWNSMASQPNLLDSNSIAGGFRISTQATPPNAKGATWNQS
ncbi:MAG: hypothetical protein WA814_12450, partial [Candidatus Baltobacteraceae bacterium]